MPAFISKATTAQGRGKHPSQQLFTVVTLVFLLLLQSLIAAGAAETNAVNGGYRIQPFDMLEINVYREMDLCLKARVSQTGNISYPLLGSVQVNGLTAVEAQEKLTKLLGKDYLVNPRVTVSVEASITQRVIIFGQVKSPGAYEISTTESVSVLQLVARAGGFTDIAATDKVTVVRSEGSKQQKIIVNVAAIIKGGDKSNNITLRPGDIVSVPETIF